MGLQFVNLVRGKACAVLACLVLAACGGGGGGGSQAADAGSSPATGVSGDLGISLSASSLALERDLLHSGSAEQATVSLAVAGSSGYWYRLNYSTNALIHVGVAYRTADQGLDFQILTKAASILAAGSYDDSLTVDICLDAGCSKFAKGSPFVTLIHTTVGHFAQAEAGVEALQVASSVTLPHDLVDAAYSAALDAVVSVSSLPAPALNVHDLVSGQTRSVALSSPPTALSLAPDGLHAAVGHDGAVSRVSLSGPGLAVSRHGVGIAAGAVLLDAQGRVHVFGNQSFASNAIVTLDATTNAETAWPGILVYGVAHAALHPSGGRMYLANENVSPDDIFAVDLSVDTGWTTVDSRYHGDYPMCGRVWPTPDGQSLYTGCGARFSSAADPALDMVYRGTLALNPAQATTIDRRVAVSLSSSPPGDEVVLLAQQPYYCNSRSSAIDLCFTRLMRFDPVGLQARSVLSLPPIALGAQRHAQVGRHVFHRGNGQIVLLSELRGAPDATAAVRLSRLP